MRAFHNDVSVQQLYLGRVAAHAAADEITQGIYWENGRGCAVGCTIHGRQHSKYENELGIPTELAVLQDSIFEALPVEEAKKFPLQFLEAIPLGADLSRVWAAFNLSILIDEKDGLIAVPNISDDCKGWIRTIAVLYQCSASGAVPTKQQKVEATRAARDAWAAWTAWAARVAWDAWAAWAARDAWDARAAWAAWDNWDNWEARIMRQRDVLLQLLREAPVPHE